MWAPPRAATAFANRQAVLLGRKAFPLAFSLLPFPFSLLCGCSLGPSEGLRKERIDLLLRVALPSSAREGGFRDFVGLPICGRRVLEDRTRLVHQRFTPIGNRGHVDHLVVHVSQQRAILLGEQPETGRSRAMPVDPRLEIQGDIDCARRQRRRRR